MKSFSEWLNESHPGFGDARAFNLKYGGKPDMHPLAGGLRATGGGLFGDPNMLTRKRDRAIFSKDIPPGAKVVNVDTDGDMYYRVIEMPNGIFKVQHSKTLDDNFNEIPVDDIDWSFKRGLGWTGHWDRALMGNPV